jgi:GNAT superfamily N-acetyltransferase
MMSIDALKKLWKQAFGDTDAFLDHFYAAGFEPMRCRCLMDGDRLAAALYWFDCFAGERKYAYLYAVATEKSYRHRGLCRYLMEDTHRILKEAGYRGAVLVPAGAELTAMYARLGYVPLSGMDSLSATAGGESIPLTQIDAPRYAARRRTYLGNTGLIQEGAGLNFLAGLAAFYEGEDFLLAASREGNHLFGMEFFGNEARIPGILTALGAETGSFRTPGSEKPFALYASLDGKPAPQYFGLAFD